MLSGNRKSTSWLHVFATEGCVSKSNMWVSATGSRMHGGICHTLLDMRQTEHSRTHLKMEQKPAPRSWHLAARFRPRSVTPHCTYQPEDHICRLSFPECSARFTQKGNLHHSSNRRVHHLPSVECTKGKHWSALLAQTGPALSLIHI